MLVAFDLDGTLIDARNIHFECFNVALDLVGVEPLSLSEHLRRFDGLPSKEKMRMLVVEGRLPDRLQRVVEAEKRRLTMERIVPEGRIPRLNEIFDALKNLGHHTAVVSNARFETVNRVLEVLRIAPDCVISNEDVEHAKPHPEGYLRAMLATGHGPKTTIILEDAPAGKQAARASGGRLIPVFDPADMKWSNIAHYLAGGSSFDVVMPMAGDGRRFKDAGHILPKPLIDVDGMPMIGIATSTLDLPEARHIFLARSEHLSQWATDPVLRSLARDVTIREVPALTSGAAATVLLARDLIDSDRPCVVANSDQWIGWDSDQAIHSMISRNWDAAALIFDAPDHDRKWSYAEVDRESQRIIRTAEKDPISDHALCGVFMYRRGRQLVRSIDMMMQHGERVNGEWYVAPSLNHLPGARGAIRAEMKGLGTPQDLNEFLSGR